MPPSTAAQPRAARPPRARKKRVYNVAGLLTIEQIGVQEAAERLERLAERAQEPTTLLAAADPVYEAEKRLFESHGAGHWKPTSRETTAEKRSKGQRTEPMRATDRTFQSLTMPPSKLPAGRKRDGILTLRKHNTELRIGSRTAAAVFQKREGRDALIVDNEGRRGVVAVLTKQLLS